MEDVLLDAGLHCEFLSLSFRVFSENSGLFFPTLVLSGHRMTLLSLIQHQTIQSHTLLLSNVPFTCTYLLNSHYFAKSN